MADIKYESHYVGQTTDNISRYELVSYIFCNQCGGVISGPPHNPNITGVAYKVCSCVRVSASERTGWKCPDCKVIHSPDTKTCQCNNGINQ